MARIIIDTNCLIFLVMKYTSIEDLIYINRRFKLCLTLCILKEIKKISKVCFSKICFLINAKIIRKINCFKIDKLKLFNSHRYFKIGSLFKHVNNSQNIINLRGGNKKQKIEKTKKKKLYIRYIIVISITIILTLLILYIYINTRVKVIPEISSDITNNSNITSFDYKQNCKKYKEYKEACSSLESRKEDCSEEEKIINNIKDKYNGIDINLKNNYKKNDIDLCENIETFNEPCFALYFKKYKEVCGNIEEFDKFCLSINFKKYKEVCLQLKKEAKKRKYINRYVRDCVKGGQTKKFCQNVAKIMYKKKEGK
jgi:hypothetical protein